MELAGQLHTLHRLWISALHSGSADKSESVEKSNAVGTRYSDPRLSESTVALTSWKIFSPRAIPTQNYGGFPVENTAKS
jgi:hypothetical protein